MSRKVKRNMKKAKSFVALALAMITFMSFFMVGCGDLKWSTDIEDTLELDAVFATSGTDLCLELSYESDIFSEKIDKDMVMVTSYQGGQEEITEEEYDVDEVSSTEITISDFDVIYNSGKKITINLGENVSNATPYYVAIHSNATTVGEYAEGYVEAYSEVEITYSASIDETYTAGNTNPVFEITLENTTMVDNYSKDMVSFAGAFSDLEVDTISGSGSNIVVSTTGSVTNDTSLYGYVELSSELTNCGSSFSVCVEVERLSAWVDESSYILADSLLQFDLILGGDTFVSDKVIIDGYNTLAVSEDMTAITLEIASEANDIDTALESICGSTITIDKSYLSSNIEAEVTIFAIEANLLVVSDYLVETSTTGEYSFQATIVAQNGSFGTITADSVSFDDDFESLKDITLTESGNSYVMNATLVDTDLDIDSYVLSGYMTVTSGGIINKWGSTSDNTTCEFVFSSVEDRGVLDNIKAFVNKYQADFETLGTIGKAAGAVSSTVSAVTTVLELCGVVESTSDTLTSIRDTVVYTQQMVAEVSSKIDSLSALAKDSLSKVYDATYNTAANNWNSFLSNSATPLVNVVSNYKQYYNEYMLNFIGNAETASMQIVIDTDGDINLSHPNMSGFTVDGKVVASSDSYIVASELTSIKQAVASNGGRLPDNYWSLLEKYFTDNMFSVLKVVDGEDNISSGLSCENYLSALQLNASYYAQNKIGSEEIINAYSNFCNALAGTIAGSASSSASKKPLDYYNQMLESSYNFYSEASVDMEIMKNWLYSVAIESSGIAIFAHACTPAASATVVSNAYTTAMNQLDIGVGEQTVAAGKQYSYVVGKALSQGYESFEYEYQLLYFNETTGNVVDSEKLGKMRNRYNAIKSSGGTTASSFGDYLASYGLVSWGWQDYVIATSAVKKGTIATDNKTKVICQKIYSGTNWFKVGTEYSIGTSGKYDACHFVWTGSIEGSFETPDGEYTYTYILLYARYLETHWYWGGDDESAWFRTLISTKYNYIVIG